MDILNTKIKNILTEKNTKIKPENIKKDVNILGITGTYEGERKSFPPDWSQIGYEDTPQGIIEGFNYAEEIKDNWDSSITNLSRKFYNNDLLKFMPMVDTSKAINALNMFFNCSYLMAIPLLNISNINNTNSMFYGCSSLIEIPHFDVSNATTCSSMFQGCSNLKTVPNLNISKAINVTNMFFNCNNLSNESLNNIMGICISATSYTGTKTLKQIGLSSTQATTCQTLSNYQAFLDAGWTTGY